jgi:hypothetical protein
MQDLHRDSTPQHLNTICQEQFCSVQLYVTNPDARRYNSQPSVGSFIVGLVFHGMYEADSYRDPLVNGWALVRQVLYELQLEHLWAITWNGTSDFTLQSLHRIQTWQNRMTREIQMSTRSNMRIQLLIILWANYQFILVCFRHRCCCNLWNWERLLWKC